MNNDIPRDYTSYNKIPVYKNAEAESKTTKEDLTDKTSDVSMEDALRYLSSIGQTKVSMDRVNSIRKSVEQFQQNPFEIEARMDFCDSILNEGYDIQKAMDITDMVFDALKQEDTYRN